MYVKEGCPELNRYFTVINSSSIKTVADRQVSGTYWLVTLIITSSQALLINFLGEPASITLNNL